MQSTNKHIKFKTSLSVIKREYYLYRSLFCLLIDVHPSIWCIPRVCRIKQFLNSDITAFFAKLSFLQFACIPHLYFWFCNDMHILCNIIKMVSIPTTPCAHTCFVILPRDELWALPLSCSPAP